MNVRSFAMNWKIIDLFRIANLYFRYKPRIFLNQIRNRKIKNVAQVYWMDPGRINLVANGRINSKGDTGRIIGGNWDLERSEFDEFWVYRGYKERYLENKKWADTEFYQKVIDKIRKGERPWMCDGEHDFNVRLSNIDRLYEHIKAHGFTDKVDEMINVYSYKSSSFQKAMRAQKTLELGSVSIDRYGNPIILEGKNRLAIAKIIVTRPIPVYVRVWHQQYVESDDFDSNDPMRIRSSKCGNEHGKIKK